MLDELIEIRQTLFSLIRGGERKNRRALLLAYKHVDKAARVLGAPKQEMPKRMNAASAPMYKNVEKEPEPIREDSPVLATNAPIDNLGAEKPIKKRKA